MKQIWAPWRMDYIHGEKAEGCIFCDKAAGGDPRVDLVLAQTPYSVVMLNKYPYNSGHLLLAPKRHTNQFSALPSEEYADFSWAFRVAVDNLSKALNPQGITWNEPGKLCGGRSRGSYPLASGPSLGRRYKFHAGDR